MRLFLIMVTVGFFGVIACAAATPHGPPLPPSCRTDWTLCADNSDMANKYREWTQAKVACEFAANDRARYGTPEWPFPPFSFFYHGDDYRKTGKATLIEPDAKFQNRSGAMVRSRVECDYDLRSKAVTNIIITHRRKDRGDRPPAEGGRHRLADPVTLRQNTRSIPDAESLDPIEGRTFGRPVGTLCA